MIFRLSSVPLLILLLCSSVATAGRDLLPRPASLEHQVRFWTRVYSEIDRDGGFIHDSRNLDVIYESVRVPRDLSRRTREHRIDRVKKKYIQILRKLGKGNRTGLSAEESRVLALFPDGVSNRRLQKAAKLVRFQLGQADRFRDGLKRSTRWRDHIDRALRRHGVPPELAALPHVESSFNPAAYSSVGAAGLWQFTRSTGRLFLRVDNVVDERMDPLLASDGAARLLRANYDDLGSWPLAITAYNHGAGGMARAVRKLGTDDLGVIVEKYNGRTFGFASRNFYTEFIAALHVDRNADRYFGPIDHDSPVDYERVTIDDFYPAVALEAALGVDRELLREHNRSLRPAVWNGAKYVPRGFELKVPADAVRTPLATALAKIPAPQRFAKQHRDRLYKVRRGDTLSRIARRYHVKERTLMALNNIRSRNRIRAGQVLTLPDAPGARAPLSVARAEAPKDGHYRVRRGDTLSTIAARFGVSETKLVSLNGLRNRNRLAVGQRLQLRSDPAPSETARPAPAPPAPVATPEPVVVAAAPEIPEAPETPPAPEVAAPAPSVPTPAPVPVAAVPAAAVPVAAEPVVAEPVVVEPVAVEPVAVEPAAESPAPVVVASARSAQPIEPAPEPEAEPTVGSSPVIPKADPSDYAVTASGRITVQAAETLGHYADWLEIPTSRLRRLNKMSYRTPVAIGRQTKLEFSKVTPEQFEQRRLEYHHTLQEEYFDAYEVTGTDTHVLRAGDTLWELAEVRYQVPVWLLRQYNPVLDFGALQAGTRLVIPQISPRTS